MTGVNKKAKSEKFVVENVVENDFPVGRPKAEPL